MVGDGAAKLVARAFEAAGLPLPADALERFLAIYDDASHGAHSPVPGIPETLAALRRRTTLGMLTNKPRRATLTILGRLGLDQYFAPELVLGGDGPLPRKPDPRGLLGLIQRAHADRLETLLVGDSHIDWQTAHEAGTRICMAALWLWF